MISISKMIDEQKSRFASVSPALIATASGEHGFDMLKFWASMKDQLPIHYKLFRSVDTALPSEANCERVFSFALSDSRQSLSSLHLEKTVSVAFRWPYFKSSVKMVRAKYDALLKGESAQRQGGVQ